ncbi:MAG: TIGR00282 family metallophosphoesterase [Acidobacteria bacterium]|nr:MAG: TIGR00282 family metallophosphoesterase [Acidobacteriota bacterium]
MKILFIGDTVGKAGRSIVHQYLKELQETLAVDLTILNCENAAAGFGVTPKIADEFFDWGIDVLTSGNHIWDKKEIMPYLSTNSRLLRPANYPEDNPGRGLTILKTRSGEEAAVLNLQGRVFMPPTDDPFRVADAELAKIPNHIKVIFVDMHGEATSEKVAMGWYLDGRVSAVVGTHTHIPTADETILPGGTAFLTDVGMAGPFHSVIGVIKEEVIRRFLTSIPDKFEAASLDARLNAVFVDVDSATGKARSIERIHKR